MLIYILVLIQLSNDVLQILQSETVLELSCAAICLVIDFSKIVLRFKKKATFIHIVLLFQSAATFGIQNQGYYLIYLAYLQVAYEVLPSCRLSQYMQLFKIFLILLFSVQYKTLEIIRASLAFVMLSLTYLLLEKKKINGSQFASPKNVSLTDHNIFQSFGVTQQLTEQKGLPNHGSGSLVKLDGKFNIKSWNAEMAQIQQLFPVKQLLQFVIITHIDQQSTFLLKFKQKQTLEQLMSLIRQSDHQLPVTIISSESEFLNAYLVKIHFQDNEFELQFHDIKERDQHLKKSHTFNIMKLIFTTLSHEFGTGLNYIMAIASQLSVYYRDDSIRQICHASHILNYQLLDLIDFNDMMGDSFQLQIQQVDLNELLKEVNSFFAKQLSEKGIQTSFTNLSQYQTIGSDSRRIKQVLIAIIANAQKFTSSGQIIVQINQLNKQEIEISVSDTGIGMSQQEIQQLMNKLVTGNELDKQISKHTAGFGMGSYLSNQIAIKLGQGLQYTRLEKGLKVSFIVKHYQINLKASEDTPGIQQYGEGAFVDIRQSQMEFLVQSKSSKSPYRSSIQRPTLKIPIISEQFAQEYVKKSESLEYAPIVQLQVEQSPQFLALIQSADDIEFEVNQLEQSEKMQQFRFCNLKGVTGSQALCSCTRILIVDDEMINIMSMRIILRSMGYEADHCFNGLECLHKLHINQRAHCKYLLILMDINMPIMDGHQATVQIIQNYGKVYHIAACTAFTDAETRIKSYEKGMESFLTKPIKKEDLMKILQFLFNQF